MYNAALFEHSDGHIRTFLVQQRVVFLVHYHGNNNNNNNTNTWTTSENILSVIEYVTQLFIYCLSIGENMYRLLTTLVSVNQWLTLVYILKQTNRKKRDHYNRSSL